MRSFAFGHFRSDPLSPSLTYQDMFVLQPRTGVAETVRLAIDTAAKREAVDQTAKGAATSRRSALTEAIRANLPGQQKVLNMQHGVKARWLLDTGEDGRDTSLGNERVQPGKHPLPNR